MYISLFSFHDWKKIKSSRKEYAIRTCFKFWPMKKHFPKTISQWEFYYGLFANLPRIIVACDFSPSLFKLKRAILPLLKSRYSNFKTTCHVKLKFFLWTKLLDNLLLAKYLISDTGTLSIMLSFRKPNWDACSLSSLTTSFPC